MGPRSVSPGGSDIDQLLESCGGGLIILDEVVNYIEKAAAVHVQESTLKAQTLIFLQTLTARAGAHDRVVVAATLPKSHLEVHGTASAASGPNPTLATNAANGRREPTPTGFCTATNDGFPSDLSKLVTLRMF